MMDPGEQDKVPRSELQIREYISAFLWVGLLFALTAWLRVSLDNSPQAPPVATAKAPWVFGAIQLLLQRWPMWLSGWAFPLFSAAVLFTLPWWAEKLKTQWMRLIFLIFSGVWVGLTLSYFFMG